MRSPTAYTQASATGVFYGGFFNPVATTPLKVGPGGRAAIQLHHERNIEKYVMQFEMNLSVGESTPNSHCWARIPDHYMEYHHGQYKPYSTTHFITGASMAGHFPQDTWVRARVYNLNSDNALIRIRVTTS